MNIFLIAIGVLLAAFAVWQLRMSQRLGRYGSPVSDKGREAKTAHEYLGGSALFTALVAGVWLLAGIFWDQFSEIHPLLALIVGIASLIVVIFAALFAHYGRMLFTELEDARKIREKQERDAKAKEAAAEHDSAARTSLA